MVNAADPPVPANGDVAAAVGAATRAAALSGMGSAAPTVIQATNNVVVLLPPHDVIAKVGRWPHSLDALRREHAVATHLEAAGAPIAPPLPNVGPIVDEATGFVVTLWRRLNVDEDRGVSTVEAARTLRLVHAEMARYDGPLPDVRRHVELARGALDDDGAMTALPERDRDTLRNAIDSLTRRLDAFDAVPQVLHGEPHLGNVLPTPDGLRWLDLEDVCLGPLEWDVAFLPRDAEPTFDGIDAAVMEVVRTLVSACVATWCWVRADLEGMLPHALHHLERVRAALDA